METHHHSHEQPPAAVPAPTGTNTIVPQEHAFEELASALAQQGFFGKLRIGASLLLFGEATLPSHDHSPH